MHVERPEQGTLSAIEIPLRDRAGALRAVALVDPADSELAGVKWHLSSWGYAQRNLPRGAPRPRHAYLHREVLELEPGDGLQVDHINGNRLDCRRRNLRIVTLEENRQNVVMPHGSSKYRGVSFEKQTGKWRAYLRADGKLVRLGRFDSEQAAAAAARAARERHQPFANETRHP